MASQPTRREQFEIAIICALPLEYDAICPLFDELWDENGDQYGRAPGDTNNYTTGRIGKYNVVLALLSHMGKANAASAAASVRSSYGGITLALLVGICGGVPQPDDRDEEIFLGDVIISKIVVQYDFGRQYPDRFIRKDTVHDNLAKPNKDIRNLLVTFETERGRDRLQERSAYYLEELQTKTARKRPGKYKYPGMAKDKLFLPEYRHKHHKSPTCICQNCHTDADPVCDDALGAGCHILGCDDGQLTSRRRPDESDELIQPAIHVGGVASGDTVLKSAADRDRIARKEGVIAFEMEGAGMWEEVPCVVVKGVCDYADCHKSKGWQNFAAATAAATSKAILERYTQTDKPSTGGGLTTDHAATGAVASPAGSQNDNNSQSRGGPVFHGPISGQYVIPGTYTTGGTVNFNFAGRGQDETPTRREQHERLPWRE